MSEALTYGNFEFVMKALPESSGRGEVELAVTDKQNTLGNLGVGRLTSTFHTMLTQDRGLHLKVQTLPQGPDPRVHKYLFYARTSFEITWGADGMPSATGFQGEERVQPSSESILRELTSVIQQHFQNRSRSSSAGENPGQPDF
jgi:hypothetical protein